MGTGAAGRSALVGCPLQGTGHQEADAVPGVDAGSLQVSLDHLAQLGMQLNALTEQGALYSADCHERGDQARLPALGRASVCTHSLSTRPEPV